MSSAADNVISFSCKKVIISGGNVSWGPTMFEVLLVNKKIEIK